MRITPSKVLNTFTGLVIVGLVYVIFSSNRFGARIQGGRDDGTNNFTKTCVVPKAHRDGLHLLTQLVHGILEGLDVTHFLCYGSLFGQIRQVKVMLMPRNAVQFPQNFVCLAFAPFSICYFRDMKMGPRCGALFFFLNQGKIPNEKCY